MKPSLVKTVLHKVHADTLVYKKKLQNDSFGHTRTRGQRFYRYYSFQSYFKTSFTKNFVTFFFETI